MSKCELKLCSGDRWLATAPPEAPVKIGVFAESAEVALIKLESAMQQWQQLSGITANTLPTGETQEPQSQHRSP